MELIGNITYDDIIGLLELDADKVIFKNYMLLLKCFTLVWANVKDDEKHAKSVIGDILRYH